MAKYHTYSMFHNFIDKYISQGFMNISRQDPMIIEMEEKLSANNQFFYVADLLRLQLHFISMGSTNIIGVSPDEFNLSTLFSRTHPGDQPRHGISRAKIIRIGQDLFLKKKGGAILSTHFRQKSHSGIYFNLLYQGYMFYSAIPFKTVYLILILTDLSKFNISKHGFHFYLGNDPKFFHYPDTVLLKIGHTFSDREFEILQLIAAGLDSHKIADKLLLSVHTVNTHRKNMLKKTKKSTTQDIVIELMERGIL